MSNRLYLTGRTVLLALIRSKAYCSSCVFFLRICRDGNSSPAMGASNQVGLCSLSTQFQTRFLESIPRPIAGLKFPTQVSVRVGEELGYRVTKGVSIKYKKNK
jgi:hypothetical protein